MCTATVKKKGALTAGARKLFEMIRELPDGEIKVRQQDNHWIEVSAGKSRFTSSGSIAREFPAMPEPPAEDAGIRVSAETFIEMIEYTLFAVSADETRVNLNGIHVERTR